MTTGNPRRDAKVSIIGLGIFALIGMIGVAYVLDRWLVGGLIAKRVAEACKSAVSACGEAITPLASYMPDAKIFIAALSLGALIFAGLKAAGVLYFARKIKHAEGPSIDVPERIRKVAFEIGAGDVPIRYIDSEIPIAYTDGIFRTSIHLSRGLAEALDEDQLKGVLAHEYAHVARKDNLSIFAALALRDFLFVFPLSHLLFSVFMRQKEHAADDLAAEMTGDPVGLADAIVKVAKLKGAGESPCPAYATFFPDKAAVRDRVTRLLGHAYAGKLGMRKLAVATLITVLMIAGLAGISVAETPKAQLNKACLQKPECVNQGGACCI